MKLLVLASALLPLLTAASCSPQDEAGGPIVTPTTMVHQSSMGELVSRWSITEIPEEFRGEWRLQSTTDTPLASAFGSDYSSLVFRLTRSPAECRVLLDEPGGLREIGTMPYVFLDGQDLVTVFAGDFHLTYSLRIHQSEQGELAGVFNHSGSGVVYFEGDVRLVVP